MHVVMTFDLRSYLTTGCSEPVFSKSHCDLAANQMKEADPVTEVTGVPRLPKTLPLQALQYLSLPLDGDRGFQSE
ncbi:unnamed protein product [Arctogadus glacialis]